MIQDKQLEFSNAQAITATAASTNQVDLGARGAWGPGSVPEGEIDIALTVTANFNNLTSLTVTVRSSDAANMSSPVSHESVTIPLADLQIGKRLPLLRFPRNSKRYVDLNYTVTGTNPAAGAITARGTVKGQINT